MLNIKSSTNLKINEIITILKKETKKFTNPIVTELADITKDPYIVLISCLLSLRTKDSVTAIASKKLFELAKTSEEMVKLSNKQIEKAIYPVGFYKTKARRIKEISKELIDNYNSKVPNSFEELLKLKGIGKKTAAITMVYGHNDPSFIPVDVHLHVITNRLGWVKTKNPDDTMDKLMKVIPKQYWYDLNDLLVQFGQNICVTVSPFCSKCPINDYCPKIDVKKHR